MSRTAYIRGYLAKMAEQVPSYGWGSIADAGRSPIGKKERPPTREIRTNGPYQRPEGPRPVPTSAPDRTFAATGGPMP